MKILVTGSSGLVGKAVVSALAAERHTVVPLVRPGRALGPGEARWDPAAGKIDPGVAEAAEAIIHLAGASIAQGRWSESRQQLLRSSRVDATRLLVSALAALPSRPKVLVSASAVGYYGDRGEEMLTEGSRPGNDFLARLARDWEAEAFRAEGLGIRTVALRFGVILAAHGGALARMLPPFRLGLGGRLGSGKQWMSWVTLQEVVRIIRQAVATPGWRGPMNAVAPHPVTNAEFTRTLGRVLRRPTIFPVPAFVLRVALGELADALLLSSQRALPKKMEQAGYSFIHQALEEGLESILGTAR